ncbi:hypothetical protein [Lysinibacillus sp. RC79]
MKDWISLIEMTNIKSGLSDGRNIQREWGFHVNNDLLYQDLKK